jgi:hypothetical protein
MLIRVRGGSSGIKDYLENGHKAGREFSRNELDVRVPLAGNLATVDSIINGMDRHGQRYLHITLAFKENHIHDDMMTAIVEEARKFIFSACEDGEYSFYAEAHVPKILGYAHARTGERIVRRPHIHMVVPLENMLTGMHLNPLGRVEYQEKFLDALQEHINNEFGLASPKDNPSLEFNDASEMFTRYTGEELRAASGAAREMKKEVLRQVIGRQIESLDELQALLAEFGVVTARNKGTAWEYFNLKPDPKGKGVNFNDERFKRAFIELPTADKVAALGGAVQAAYSEAQAARKDPAHVASQLARWYDTRALEVRYVFNQSEDFKNRYKAADAGEQRHMLSQQKERNAERNRLALSHVAEALAVPELEQERAPTAQAADVDADEDFREPSAKELDVQLAADEPIQPGNVIAHMWQEAQAAVAAREAEAAIGLTEPSVTEIRRRLDGARLLAHVSHAYGADVSVYEVVKHKDGHDLIRCGTRHYTVNDFLTKELRLNYGKEAEPLLRECYAAQQSSIVVSPCAVPQKSLWQQFQVWKAGEGRSDRTTAWEVQRATEKERFAAMRTTYLAEKEVHHRSWKGKRGDDARAQRASALSVLRTQYAVKQTILRADIRDERLAFRERYRSGQLYRDFLRKQVEHGNGKALAELRRQSLREVAAERVKDRSATIGAVDQAKIRDDALLLKNMTYQVDPWGDVTYRAQGAALFRDERERVAIFQHDTDTLETALRLSMQKFGSSIALYGTDEFKRRCAEVAVERGLKIQFGDPDIQRYADGLAEDAARVKSTPKRILMLAENVEAVRSMEDDLMSESMRALVEEERRKQQAKAAKNPDRDQDPSEPDYGPE